MCVVPNVNNETVTNTLSYSEVGLSQQEIYFVIIVHKHSSTRRAASPFRCRWSEQGKRARERERERGRKVERERNHRGAIVRPQDSLQLPERNRRQVGDDGSGFTVPKRKGRLQGLAHDRAIGSTLHYTDSNPPPS